MRILTLKVNGATHRVAAEDSELLVDVLRERLGLTGTKKGCGAGECGACTVLLDGKLVNSCLLLAVQAQGKEITTIEGLSRQGKLHPVQEAFLATDAIQCGYCTPGMVLAAKTFLEEHGDFTESDLKREMAGNICRCTGYAKIIQAVKLAARGRGGGEWW